MAIHFCCPGFKNLIENAGQTGPAAIVVWRGPDQPQVPPPVEGGPYEDEAEAKRTRIPLKIEVSSTMGLQYWPFCSRRLQ